MAVIDVLEAVGGRAWQNREGTGAIRNFTVHTDAWDSNVIARRAPGIPIRGQKHLDDPNLRVISSDASRVGLSHQFNVIVQYRTGSARIGGSDAVHPLKRPIRKGVGSRTVMLPVDFAVDGKHTRKTMQILRGAGINVQEKESVFRGGIKYKIRRVKCPIVNTAGSVPNPKAMVELAVPTLTLTTNIKNYDENIYFPFWNTINKSNFRGHKKGTALLSTVLGYEEEEEVNGKAFEYFSLVHTLLIQPWGFPWRMKNEGEVYFDHTFDEALVIRDNKSGIPLGEPRLLDRKGEVADADAAPIWLYYDLLEEKSWKKLNIG